MADCRSGVSATRPLTMVGASMPETKMDSAKSTSTPWKVFGRCCAPGCGRTAASRRRSCPTISPSSNSCTTPDVGAKPYSEPCWPPCCPPPQNPNRAFQKIPGGTSMLTDFTYQSGFGNGFETEALPGALPIGHNSPQKCAYGLYAEQLSGSPFTAPRASNERSWLYRIRPTVANWGRFTKADAGLWRTAPCAEVEMPIQ